MTRREQVLEAIRVYRSTGVSAINISYITGAPRSTVRRETQALRKSGAVKAVDAASWDIDKVLFVAAEYQPVIVAADIPERVESHKRYSSMA